MIHQAYNSLAGRPVPSNGSGVFSFVVRHG